MIDDMMEMLDERLENIYDNKYTIGLIRALRTGVAFFVAFTIYDLSLNPEFSIFGGLAIAYLGKTIRAMLPDSSWAKYLPF